MTSQDRAAALSIFGTKLKRQKALAAFPVTLDGRNRYRAMYQVLFNIMVNGSTLIYTDYLP